MTEYYANWPFDQQATSDEAKKKLIDHIKKTNRELGFYEWHADMISENMSEPRADDHKRRTTAPTRNYLNGLLSAYELIYGKNKELQDLREYLLQRRIRVHKFMTAARRLYWKRSREASKGVIVNQLVSEESKDE